MLDTGLESQALGGGGDKVVDSLTSHSDSPGAMPEKVENESLQTSEEADAPTYRYNLRSWLVQFKLQFLLQGSWLQFLVTVLSRQQRVQDPEIWTKDMCS